MRMRRWRGRQETSLEALNNGIWDTGAADASWAGKLETRPGVCGLKASWGGRLETMPWDVAGRWPGCWAGSHSAGKLMA